MVLVRAQRPKSEGIQRTHGVLQKPLIGKAKTLCGYMVSPAEYSEGEPTCMCCQTAMVGRMGPTWGNSSTRKEEYGSRS